MPEAGTERLHPLAEGLDTLPGSEVLDRLLSAQAAALAAVRPALPALDAGAALMAQAVAAGGALVYAGAGSSALMAMADALELPATFGLPPGRVGILMAGGLPRTAQMPGASEDDTDAAAADAGRIRRGDVVIAVTASGSTPYALAVATAARARGASVIAIANNPGAAIFAAADVRVCLATPPEIIAGSTRMGAGTAQKVALNLMSTLMGIRIGAVHDGRMVAVVADNAKLRDRARAMVETIAGTDAATAGAALAATGFAVKPAVLVARGLTAGDAARALAESGGNLRAALARLHTTGPQKPAIPDQPGSLT
jgi:N-acetylmuramic acid 6-phosphate etherase